LNELGRKENEKKEEGEEEEEIIARLWMRE
jgi:hypothetical protein